MANQSNGRETWHDFGGQVAVVTGGSGVLGGAMARAVGRSGAKLVLLSRSAEKLQAAVAAFQSEGIEAGSVQADVLDRAALERASGEVMARYGRIDILINAAGGNQPGATATKEQPFFDLAPEAMRSVLDANLTGTLFACQAFGRHMAKAGKGGILNVSSMAAQKPLTRVAVYAAAKAGIDNFTRWLATHMAQEYSPQIRVNAIAPGFFLGEQNRYLLLDRQTGELTARGKLIIENTPMRRFGEPDDLAGATLFLLSPASAFVTGVVVPVDGGYSAFGGV